MCGICGLCAPAVQLDGAGAALTAMQSALWHRGPDSRGAYVDEHVALGNQRLAVIDLNGGDQPICSEDGAIRAVYNGEIYNFRELADDLRRRGHRLASNTDSEVLVHLYEDHGIGFVSRLNGMFAFALWDAHLRRLHLVRDRYGVKPIYYHWRDGKLAFASEVKGLLKAGVVDPRLDLDAFVELMTFQNILSHRSLFADVLMVPPASILTVDADGMRVTSYWEGLPEPEEGGTISEFAAETGILFEQAVERQLVADVEVASYLSGGLDTGSITAAAASRLGRLTTFCTGFDTAGAEGREAGFDERADAAELARILGTHHHELVLDSHDMEMVMPRLMLHLEEPRMSFSYPNYLTAGTASRWVKVVLSGAGGDEIFGGYPWRYTFASEPNFVDRFYDYWTRLMAPSVLSEALTPAVRGDVDFERPRRVFDTILEPAAHLPRLDQSLYFEFRTFLHGLLVLEDKLSMAHSLETRVPFLDNDLVDYALTIPASRKLHGQSSKDLFRRAMSSRLPEQVTHRAKTGFTPPQAAWFRGPQCSYMESVLLSERARDRRLFRDEVVRRLLTEHRDGQVDHRLVLWTMLCLEWWHRLFIDEEYAT